MYQLHRELCKMFLKFSKTSDVSGHCHNIFNYFKTKLESLSICHYGVIKLPRSTQ